MTKTFLFQSLELATKAFDSHPPSAELHTGTRWRSCDLHFQITAQIYFGLGFILRTCRFYCEK